MYPALCFLGMPDLLKHVLNALFLFSFLYSSHVFFLLWFVLSMGKIGVVSSWFSFFMLKKKNQAVDKFNY